MTMFLAYLMSLLPPHKILLILSAGFYFVGTVFLAKSIRWESQNLSGGGHDQLAKRVRKFNSVGRTDVFRLITGMILNAVGFSLIVISIAVSP
jgi:uncharacterized membrane protein